jgi:hypothetical protein
MLIHAFGDAYAHSYDSPTESSSLAMKTIGRYRLDNQVIGVLTVIVAFEAYFKTVPPSKTVFVPEQVTDAEI